MARNQVQFQRGLSTVEFQRLPVHVVATDILSGEAVTLSRGSATQAVLASSTQHGPPISVQK